MVPPVPPITSRNVEVAWQLGLRKALKAQVAALGRSAEDAAGSTTRVEPMARRSFSASGMGMGSGEMFAVESVGMLGHGSEAAADLFV